MYSIIFFKKYFYEDLKFFFSINDLFVKGKFGLINVKLYNHAFFKVITSFNLKLLFVNNVMFSSFMKYLFKLIIMISKIFFFKLRLKGLGYRMFRLTPKLIKFFFAKNHFFYFYIPYSIYVKIQRRNFFIMSFNKVLLNDLFHHLMLFKKMDFYEKTNSFVLQNRILFLKKRK